MERGLQKVNQHSRLVEWGRRVEAWRNSGQQVSKWCEEHGIAVSTYYNWQRKVWGTGKNLYGVHIGVQHFWAS